MDFPPIPNCRQRSLVSSGFLSKANPHTFPSTRGMFVRRRVDVAVGYCSCATNPQVAINLWMWSIHSFASYFALWVGLAAHAGQFRVTVVKGWLRANRAAVRRKWGRGDGHIPWCAIFNKRFFQALKHCLSRYTFLERIAIPTHDFHAPGQIAVALCSNDAKVLTPSRCSS